MEYKAIFDNTVFNIAARIQSCDLIELATNLFEHIFVPQAIHIEMQSFPPNIEPLAQMRMQRYVSAVKAVKRGIQICTTVDIIVQSNIETVPNVDKGEAEAIAQAAKRNVRYFFTDDEKCKNALADSYSDINITFAPTIYLIALLDINNFLPDYAQVMREYFAYKPLPKKGGKAFFRQQYEAAMQFYSITYDKKIINKKTSFKALGISI
jgi:predicted nucleic acid-binding protein